MNTRLSTFSILVRIVSVMLSFTTLAAAQNPLSDAELERLQQISEWDIEYTEAITMDASGGGVAPPSTPWITGFSHSHQKSFVFSFRLTVGGAGACTTPSDDVPCRLLMSPANPGELRIDKDETVDESSLDRIESGCWCDAPMASTITDRYTVTSTGGIRVLDGTPGLPASGWFGIDTRVNPPLASGSVNVFAEFPGRQVQTSCSSCAFRGTPAGCTTTRDTALPGYPHGWTNFEFGAQEAEGWGLTDTTVQVENGRFVIRSNGVFNRPTSLCLFGPVYCGAAYDNLVCSETRIEGTQTLYSSLVIREHNAPSPPLELHSVEFTQGIQILQPLELLKADLIGDGSPPMPIVAKKPVALRIYPEQVASDTTATFEVSGQINGSKTMTLQRHCTPELRRRMEQGCVSANFYFTPPVGDWAVTVKLKSPSGEVVESHDLNLTSKESNALVLKGVSVCDAVDAQGNWQCGLVNLLPSLVGLLRSILPTDDVRVEVTGHQVRRNALDYDTDGDGTFAKAESDKWWVDVLKDIRSLYQLTDLYEELKGGQQNYYYGMMRNTAPGSPGAAFPNSRSAASRSYVLTLGFVNWTEYVVAHETAHMLGRDHTSSNLPAASNSIGCWGPGAAPQDWPYADNLLRSGPAPGVLQVGFDVENGRAVLPELNFEISAYCSDGWVSPYSYPKLLAALNPAPLPASASAAGSGQASSYWRVAGTISGAAAVLEPLFTMDVLGTAEAGTGSHRIEVLDDSGAVLFTRRFTPESVHISPNPGESDVELDPYFTELVPVQPGATTITVMDSANAVLGSISLGGLVPDVTVTSPGAGDTVSGPHTITWSVLDGDSADHTFDVYYSSDGGTNWRGIGRGLNASNLKVDFGAVAGTLPGAARVRVIASDGVNTGVGTSGGFTVSKKQPSATIVFPLTEDRFARGALVLLQGVGFDLDDGLLTQGSMLWSSDVDGPLGSADVLPVYDLSPTRHRITLTATDTDGNTATADVIISVFDPPTADGDGDDDVDLVDFLRLTGCWEGAKSSPSEPACLAFDFDGDGDVDALDFAAFQNCFSGTNVLASPDCAR
jgi:hypothetical protein